MSGTDIAYQLGNVRYCYSVSARQCPVESGADFRSRFHAGAICLRACSAMSGTALAYNAIYLAYNANGQQSLSSYAFRTQCPVLTAHPFVPGHPQLLPLRQELGRVSGR
eukprot:2269749-Rhodomonas_salina.1